MKHKDILFIAWGWDYYQFLMHFFRNFFSKSFVISNNNFIFAATYSPRFPLEQRAQGESFLSFCHVQCLANRNMQMKIALILTNLYSTI